MAPCIKFNIVFQATLFHIPNKLSIKFLGMKTTLREKGKRNTKDPIYYRDEKRFQLY